MGGLYLGTCLGACTTNVMVLQSCRIDDKSSGWWLIQSVRTQRASSVNEPPEARNLMNHPNCDAS
jgi:hypothetical protein